MEEFQQELTTENNNCFINSSRKNIDDYIDKQEFRKAFGLLITVLERLEEKNRAQLIDYYSKSLTKFHILLPKYT